MYPLSYVNNTWPPRLWVWTESKIPSLGCFSACSPPGTLTLAPSGQLLRGILIGLLPHTHRHTVLGRSPKWMQKHILHANIYACSLCAWGWDLNANQMHGPHVPLRGYDTVLHISEGKKKLQTTKEQKMIQKTNKHVENSCHYWNNENKAHARLSDLSECLLFEGLSINLSLHLDRSNVL